MVYYDHAVAMMMELDRWERHGGALPLHHRQAGYGLKPLQARTRGGQFGLGLRSAVASVAAALAIMWMVVA